MSEVDDHAVVGSGQFGVGEPTEHAGRHVSEHDPLRVDRPEVGAQRLIVEVVADGCVTFGDQRSIPVAWRDEQFGPARTCKRCT